MACTTLSLHNNNDNDIGVCKGMDECDSVLCKSMGVCDRGVCEGMGGCDHWRSEVEAAGVVRPE